MMLAIVNVLPEPVAPSIVCIRKPASSPSTSWSMACGWSPVGRKSLTMRNGRSTSVAVAVVVVVVMPALYARRAAGRCGMLVLCCLRRGSPPKDG